MSLRGTASKSQSGALLREMKKQSSVGSATAGPPLKKSRAAEGALGLPRRERFSHDPQPPAHLGAAWPNTHHQASLPPRQDLGYLRRDCQLPKTAPGTLLALPSGEHFPVRGRPLPALSPSADPRTYRASLGRRWHPHGTARPGVSTPPSSAPHRELPALRAGTQPRRMGLGPLQRKARERTP